MPIFTCPGGIAANQLPVLMSIVFFLPSAGERDLAAPVLALEVHREVQLDRALEGHAVEGLALVREQPAFGDRRI
jgi:hypothetical protein